jgi:hypothetical protein
MLTRPQVYGHMTNLWNHASETGIYAGLVAYVKIWVVASNN